jgi:dextranase
MPSLELRPARGMFRPGDPVRIHALAAHLPDGEALLRLSIHCLCHRAAGMQQVLRPERGVAETTVEWLPPALAGLGYGVEATLEREGGQILARASTAFDVLSSWTAYPRYGFMTEFAPGRQGIGPTLDLLCRYHINGLQFYDWQFRHDTLVSPTPEYLDPLGRRLSLSTVRDLVGAARARGMASMAYLAVYAASRSFWESHPTWSLRDAEAQPVPFGERFLGLMDPSPGGPWARHLLAEAEGALDSLAFDGLHIDQYGDPRQGYRADGSPVDLAESFAAFVDACKDRRPEAAVLFNAIDAWPLARLARSRQDFAYLEIWPHRPQYDDLRSILEQARRDGRDTPMVAALYLPADRQENVRLVDALIAACGGTRIELGEDERLLTDPYFPNARPAPAPLLQILRQHYDFIVRYGELIGPSARAAAHAPAAGPSSVWLFPRSSPGWTTFVLLNMTGIEEASWDRPHPAPHPLGPFSLELTLPQPIQGAWWATPDEGSPSMRRLRCCAAPPGIRVEVPALARWGLVAVQTVQE